MKILGCFLGLWALSLVPTKAQDIAELPGYRPDKLVTGVVRSWGSNQMGLLMQAWEAGFERFQPGVSFADHLKGSASAMLGLEENVADLAILGRQIAPYDTYGIWRRGHQLPVEMIVASGSFDHPHKTFALTVFVNRANPLARLTLKQLDGIFGAERTGGWRGMEWNPGAARGPGENILTWGQLGLTGEWAKKPVHTYGPPSLFPGGVSYFQTRVMGGADTWAESLMEYADRAKMMKALSADPLGIAYTGACYATEQTKAVALAESAAGPYVIPSRQSVLDRSYPLARFIYIYFPPDQANGEPAEPKVDPKVREFLRYILSREGQQAVLREGSYLPLPAAVVRAQLQKLE